MAEKSAKSESSDDEKGSRPGLAARRTAARLLAAIIDKHTSADGLTDDVHGHPHYLALDRKDRALVRAMLMTALRFRVTISGLIARRLDRPLPANAHTLNHILHVALAQILFLDVPDHAAVDLAVAHASVDPRTKRFSGLVNGVLRSISRRKQLLLPKALEITIDAPDWLAHRLEQIYGAKKAAAIFEMHRRPAPIDLTVKEMPEIWAERLDGIVTPNGSVRLEKLAGSITDLPGYEEGEWWIQDAAASLPAKLFAEIEGLRIADLCAAPGGKTSQLANAGAKVTALDLSKNRVNRLKQNLRRLRLDAEIVCADITKFTPDRLFDAVLLDAPCSSTGTIRRHPDIAWTKTSADISKLAEVQYRLLRHAFDMVKPGGTLVFSNCSLDPVEGEEMVERFLGEVGQAQLWPIGGEEIPGGNDWITPVGTLRTTPADMNLGRPENSGMDGFFAARFRRLGK
ncbi:MAG: RsmB/NOP family class I SAM-dependent RNA methyltransferase [Rhizobiaceae bacterium]